MADLTSQGLYGLAYVAPSPSRKRPYHLITSDPLELRQIQEAERNVRHLVIKNHQHRDTGWKMLRLRAEGSEFYCYDSLIVNGKASHPLESDESPVRLANSLTHGRQGSSPLSTAWLREAQRPESR